MKKLEGLAPDDPTFDDQLSILMTEIRERAPEEESGIFPGMREMFSPTESATSGAGWSVKQMAPTRPHPSAPDGPPGDKIVGSVTGLLDRMRDAVSRRGTDH